jgi:hypothetical protein
MSGQTKNGDKCSHSETIGQIVLFELQICEDYRRIAHKTDIAVRSERSIVIRSSGVQCELLNTVSNEQFTHISYRECQPNDSR